MKFEIRQHVRADLGLDININKAGVASYNLKSMQPALVPSNASKCNSALETPRLLARMSTERLIVVYLVASRKSQLS